jgi:hypothetical protein
MTVIRNHAPAAILAVADPEWLKKHEEPIIEPELAIIDPHHHLWGPPRAPYLAKELWRDAKCGHNIRATVFAECTEQYRPDGPEELRPIGETEFVARIARKVPQSKVWTNPLQSVFAPASSATQICGLDVVFATFSMSTSQLVAGASVESGNRRRGIRTAR